MNKRDSRLACLAAASDIDFDDRVLSHVRMLTLSLFIPPDVTKDMLAKT